MFISGIISKDKFKWISKYLPSNAITTTEELPTMYLPLATHKLWIPEKNLKDKLRFLGIYNENYKLCKIVNEKIKYMNIKENSVIRGWDTWVETKDNHVKFTIEMEKYNRVILLKIRSCHLFRRNNYSGKYYIMENDELKEKIYTLELKKNDRNFKSKYLNHIKIIMVFVLLLLLKWCQEKHGNGL